MAISSLSLLRFTHGASPDGSCQMESNADGAAGGKRLDHADLETEDGNGGCD
jgi:hypothetical protein